MRNKEKKNIEIFTDGACSKNPGPGGYGVILKLGNTEKELSGFEPATTNNRMELTAVLVALEALKQPCSVTLYSDSKYVVDAIKKGWLKKWESNSWLKSDKKPVLNVDLWQKLLVFFKTHDVDFVWIKGHANNKYNARCDALAVRTIKENIRE
ncbi:MAG: ribonuclease HI [Oscillospiraceae bacterium]|nr:ribonuclease HI [Oscillospiraceae bacterium]